MHATFNMFTRYLMRGSYVLSHCIYLSFSQNILVLKCSYTDIVHWNLEANPHGVFATNYFQFQGWLMQVSVNKAFNLGMGSRHNVWIILKCSSIDALSICSLYNVSDPLYSDSCPYHGVCGSCHLHRILQHLSRYSQC